MPESPGFPIQRLRRLRYHPRVRDLVREHHLTRDDLIYPLFVYHGAKIEREIASMPGQFQWSLDFLPKMLDRVSEAKIPGILLFGIPAGKDELGTSACHDSGIVQEA